MVFKNNIRNIQISYVYCSIINNLNQIEMLNKEEIRLAVARIEHIITNDKVRVTSVSVDSQENSIYLELENGMNFELSASEVMIRADEQIIADTVRVSRKVVIGALVEDYISSTIIANGGLLVDILRKVGYDMFDDFSNVQLVKEYSELFNEVVIIKD